MRHSTSHERALLKGFERVAFTLAEAANRPGIKEILHGFLNTVGTSWVRVGSGKLQRIAGLEHVMHLPQDRGVFLVSNHRSFFDMYVLSSILLQRSSFIKRLYFPVRSTFFYEGVLGVGLNFLLAMMSMYPPILREKERKAFNRFSVSFLIEALQQPGTVVGFHPEGTRGKGQNPFEMLPAQAGTGELAYQARPTVVPVFIAGLSNDIVKQVKSNFDGTGTPIDIVFGAPIDLSSYYDKVPSQENYQAIADRLRKEILALGTRLQAPHSLQAHKKQSVA